MKNILILTCSLFSCLASISAQTGITISSIPDPTPFLDCNDSAEGYDVAYIYSYLDDYIANAFVENECTDPDSEVTWAHNYTGQALLYCNGSINVNIVATNSCGESDTVYAHFIVQDIEGPTLGPPSISHHDLLCDGNGNVQGLQELIDNDFYFTIEDDFCHNPTILEYSPLHFTCGQPLNASFYTRDDCFNYSQPYQVTFNIVDINVNFTEFDFPVLEGNNQANVCVQLTNESPVDVTAEISYMAQNATTGLDYASVPLTQDIIFPANSVDQQCFSVTILEDNLVEANETFGFEITNVTSSFLAGIGSNNTTKVTILDNDDNDNDNVENTVDNCPEIFNPFQEDFDNDNIGDVCDDDNTISEISEFQDYIYINKLYSGVIVRSLDGQCWVMVVQNDGTLNTVLVTCPEN